MMKKLLLAIALMLPVLAGATDIDAISREWSKMKITVGQKFWDGNTRYEVSEITSDGTIIFAGQTSDTQKGIADAVDVLRLKKTAQPGKYILTQNSSLPSPFRCQWGAEVQYIRQNGMNFLAVKNSKGQIVETLVLTPDGIERLNAQQQQMEQDLLSDFEGMCDAMLMNTHMLVTLDYEVVRVGAMRLAKVKNPDIITKTNAQLLQSEWDYREGKAEGGYDNPDGLGGDGRGADENADNLDQLKHHFKWDGMRPVLDSTEQMADVTPESFPGGLADDGRGPEETEPNGTVIQYDGEQYIRVHTAEQFLRSIISGCSILVAKDTEINLTPLLNDKAWWDKQNYYFKWCSEGQPSLTDMGQRITSEAVSDGRQLVVQNYKQMLIRGEGNSRIVVEPRYAFCIKFMGCEQIQIRNLTIGHTTGGNCLGGVIGVEGGWRINLHDCDLYGCGTYGFELNNTRDFSCYKSNIHDCTYGIMLLNNVEFAKFEQCDFFRNCEFSLIESRGSNVTFYECRFFDNNPTSPLFEFDREFFLAGCIICHPTEMLGTIHLADQSGAKNWFDPNPQNTNLPQRTIGPDQQ